MTSSLRTPPPRSVVGLRVLSSVQRTVSVVGLFLSLFAVFLVLSGCSVLLDVLFRLPRIFRYGLAFGQAVILVVWAARGPVRRLFRRSETLLDAARLDERLGTQDLFVNTLSLYERMGRAPAVEPLLEEADLRLRTLKLRDWLDLRPPLKALRVLGLAAVPWTVGLVLFPKETLFHAVRTVTPWSGKESRLFLFRYSVEPGDTSVLAGGSVTVTLTASEPLASCRIAASTGRGGRISGEMASSDGVRTFVFREVFEDFSYSIHLETLRHRRRFETPSYRVKVLRPPTLGGFSVRYTYPGHIGWPPRLQENSPDIEAPEGTVVRISASADQPLSRAFLVLTERHSVPVKGQTLSAEFKVSTSGEYAILAVGRNGLTNTDPVRHPVRALPDAPPTVAITSPGEDITVPDSFSVPLVVEAKDDYTLRLLELRIFRKDLYTGRVFPTNRVALLKAPAPSVKVSWTLSLGTYGLNPGESLHYFVLGDDGHPSGSHRVASPVYAVRFPSLEEIHRATDRTVDETAETIRKAKEVQGELLRRLDEVRRRIDQPEGLGYSDRKRLETDIARQREMLERFRSMAERLGQAVERMEKERVQSAEIVRKMAEIRRLLEEVADEEMTRALRTAEDILNRVELTEADRRRLAERLDQDRLIRRLDNALRMLEDLRTARKLDEFARRADRLLERQQELHRLTDKEVPLTEEEARGLEGRQEENRRSLEDLGRDMEAFEETREARENLGRQSLLSEMAASSDALRRKDRREALRHQTKAMSGLMDLRNRLSDAARRKRREGREETARAATDLWFQTAAATAEWARILSESVTGNRPVSQPPFPSADGRAVRTLSAVEQSVMVERALVGVKQAMRTGLERSLAVAPDLYERFDEAVGLIAASREQLARQAVPQAERSGRQALVILDRILLELLKLAGGPADGQAGGEGGEGDMDTIASGQEAINRSTQRMKGRSGPSGLDSTDQELLKELAYQQELVREALERFLGGRDGGSAESGQGGGNQGLGGDMTSVLKDMEEAVRKLRAGELDEELLRTQNRILQRMLDSQRGLRAQEESPERKAERPTVPLSGRRPTPLPPEAVRRPDETPPEERYPREYRNIVEQYLRTITP